MSWLKHYRIHRRYEMEIRKIRGHESANVKVRINGNTIELISYTTMVIRIIHEGTKRMIECTGTYSPTTRKHIGWFLREYANDLNYYNIKNIVGEGMVSL